MVDITEIDAFVQSSPYPAWLATSRGECLYVNPALERLTGLKSDQINQVDWRSFVLEEDRAAASASWQRSLASGTPCRTRVRLRGFDGTPATVELIAFGHKAGDGTEVWLFSGLPVDGPSQQHTSLETQLQATLNVIPAYTWYALPSGALTFVNKRTADFLGLPEDHPLRLGIDMGAEWDSHIPLLHPDDREESRSVWSTSLRTGCASELSFRVRDSEGGYCWFLSRAEPLRASDGTLLYWIGVNLEIGDAKRAEEKLHQSQFHLAEGQRPAHMGSWAFNPSGLFDHWSHELFQIYGLDPVKGAPSLKNYLACVHPQDREFMASLIQRMVVDASGCDVTKRIVRPDGEVRYVRCVGAPVVEDGTLQRIVGTAMDVTEHELLTQDLRRREAYLTEAQRLSHTGSFGWNVSTDEHFWSDETFRIFEFDPSSRVSLPMILERVHPQDKPLAETAITAATRGEGIDLELRLVVPDGKIKYLHVVGKAERNNTGSIEIIGAVMDVTARNLTEVELRRSKAHLADAQRLSRVGSVGMEGSTKRIFWSEEAARIYGYPPGTEPTPDLILQRSHPDDVALLIDALERAAQGGSDFNFEHRLLMPDGSIKHLHDLSHYFRDEAGNEEIVGAIMDITERKLAEEAIRRSEAYLAEAQKLSHTGSFGWKPDRGEIVWSDETYGIFEYDRAEKPTLNMVFQRIHPQDRALAQQVIDGVSRSTDFEHEYRLIMPSGAIKHIHVRAHSLLDSSGNIEVVGAVTDITERKTAEEALRCSEADLLEAQRLSHTGSWRHDVLTGIVTLSPEVHRIFDIRPGEDASTAGFFFGRIHPEDRPIEAQEYERANLAKTDFESDYRIVLPDGSIKHVHNVGHPVLDESGDIREFVGTVIDITERKRAEEERRRSEMELRQIVDIVPQLIAVYGPNRERLYANRTALDYLGMSLDEWRHKRFAASAHPDDSERLKIYTDRALSSGAADELELRLRKRDGSYRWFLARFNPWRDEQGRIIRWYYTGTDIEHRKQAEDRLRRENVALREEIIKASMFEEIVGNSPALQQVVTRVAKVAPTDSTVLITGETGTGKELIARAIHKASKRSDHAFVSVNCAATPQSLIASELFGHEKGAFTGAIQRRLGRFELAEGGTIFLDEIGELPAETQIALLRVLQEREFERVGGTKVIHADVRVIAATNRDLQASIDAGTFRSDLYYRFNVFPIEVPPLRKRKEDIPLLVGYFMDRYSSKSGKRIRSIDSATLERLMAYTWPGNIRELQNVIERSIIVCETDKFTVDESWLTPALGETDPTSRPVLRMSASEEKKAIEAALAEAQGRVSGPSGAAAKLGIPPSTLDSKIKALKINKHRFKTV